MLMLMACMGILAMSAPVIFFFFFQFLFYFNSPRDQNNYSLMIPSRKTQGFKLPIVPGCFVIWTGG